MLCISYPHRLSRSLILLILSIRFLGKDAKSRMGVLECSLANSLVPSLLLPLSLLVVPEYKKWTCLTGRGTNLTILITVLCCSITICKHADRLCKFSIVSQANTMFFAAVDSNMKVIAGIGTFIFFSETVYWTHIVGFILIFISLVLMVMDKRNKYLKSLQSSQHLVVKRESLTSRHSDGGSAEDDVEELLLGGANDQEFLLNDDEKDVYIDEDGYNLRLSLSTA